MTNRPVAPSVPGRIRRFFLGCRRDRPTSEPNQERRDILQVSEVNYFGLAALLIDNYGTDARAQAARLRQEALRAADAQAAADWLAVEQSIRLPTNHVAGVRH